jgi:hypothetical protein
LAGLLISYLAWGGDLYDPVEAKSYLTSSCIFLPPFVIPEWAFFPFTTISFEMFEAIVDCAVAFSGLRAISGESPPCH